MTDTERAEYDDVVRQLMAKCEQLAAENAALKANNASAHQTLRAIYADSTQPATVRVRAAQAALNVETPSLKPQPPAIDATCEEVIEPLADVVARQRARCDRMQRKMRDIEVLPNGLVRVLPKPGSNGSGDDSD
jgi:hypothetical protein